MRSPRGHRQPPKLLRRAGPERATCWLVSSPRLLRFARVGAGGGLELAQVEGENEAGIHVRKLRVRVRAGPIPSVARCRGLAWILSAALCGTWHEGMPGTIRR